MEEVIKLPTEITPDPLITSSVELRFISKIDPQLSVSTIIPAFADILPTVDINQIPREIRETAPNLAYATDYTLKNDKYTMAVGPKTLLFGNLDKYQLWKNYFSFIKDQIFRFISLGIMDKVTRIGVRYASIFDKNYNLDDTLKYVPYLAMKGYSESFSLNRTELRKNDYTLTLQIARNAKATKGNKSLSGILIDIDASYTAILEVNENLFRIIDELHYEEKLLFYDILKPGFIETLNPKY